MVQLDHTMRSCVIKNCTTVCLFHRNVLIIMHNCASVTCEMNAICTRFASSVSLRHMRFELYAFDIASMRQNFGQCVTASLVVKTLCAKVACTAGNSSLGVLVV